MHTSFCRNEKNTLKSRKRLFLEYLNSGFSFLFDTSQVENASLDETQHFKSYGGQAQPRYCSWKRRKRRNSRTIHVKPLSQSWDEGLQSGWPLPGWVQLGEAVVYRDALHVPGAIEAMRPHSPTVSRQRWQDRWAARMRASEEMQEYGMKAAPARDLQGADVAVPGPGTPRLDYSPHFFIPTEPQSWQLRDRTRL